MEKESQEGLFPQERGGVCKVSEEKEKGFASATDLLSLAEGVKEISLKTCGYKVKIKKATVGELSDIMNAVGDNAIEQFIWLIFKCMVQPKMAIQDIRKLPHDVLIEIGSEIAKFSGLDKDSVERIRNLLGIESAGPSS